MIQVGWKSTGVLERRSCGRSGGEDIRSMDDRKFPLDRRIPERDST